MLQGGAASVKLVATVRRCLHEVHRFLAQAKAGEIPKPQLEAAKQNRAAATKSRELRSLLSLLACTDEEPADADEVEAFDAPLLSDEAALEVEQTAEESVVEKVPPLNKLELPFSPLGCLPRPLELISSPLCSWTTTQVTRRSRAVGDGNCLFPLVYPLWIPGGESSCPGQGCGVPPRGGDHHLRLQISFPA